MVQIIFRITRVIIRAVDVRLWIIYHDSWISFIMQCVLCLLGCTEDLCKAVLLGLYAGWECDLLLSHSKLISSCVKTICDVGCRGGNNKYWSEGIMKYSCGDVYHLYDVTWNILYRNHSKCDCNICGNGTVTWICCVCICPGGSGEKSIWCSAWYGISVCDDVQVYWRVVFDVDSPLLYGHIHHI